MIYPHLFINIRADLLERPGFSLVVNNSNLVICWGTHTLSVKAGTQTITKTLPYTYTSIQTGTITLHARTCLYGGIIGISSIQYNINNTAGSSATIPAHFICVGI